MINYSPVSVIPLTLILLLPDLTGADCTHFRSALLKTGIMDTIDALREERMISCFPPGACLLLPRRNAGRTISKTE
jgi:hypothetical protein